MGIVKGPHGWVGLLPSLKGLGTGSCPGIEGRQLAFLCRRLGRWSAVACSDASP